MLNSCVPYHSLLHQARPRYSPAETYYFARMHNFSSDTIFLFYPIVGGLRIGSVSIMLTEHYYWHYGTRMIDIPEKQSDCIKDSWSI